MLLPVDGCYAAITLGEIHLGIFRAETETQREAGHNFLRSLERRFQRLDFGQEEAIAWAKLHDQLRRSGELIGERDLQIAATALAGGHSVMTGNVAEFSRVPGLEVIAPPDIPPPR